MSKTKVFIFFSVFFLLGIFVHNIILDIYFSFLVLLLLAVLFLLFFIWQKKYLLLLGFALLGFFGGIILSHSHYIKIQENFQILSHIKDKVDITVEIKSLKQITQEHQVYISKVKKLGNTVIDKSVFSEIFISSNYKLKKGDILKFTAKIYFYKNTETFQYKNYMLSQNIYFKSYPYNFETIGNNPPHPIEKSIIYLRNNLLSTIKKIYPEEEAIFLGGILLGAREELPTELKDNFNNSGLTHFIAVSGFNITILILFFSFFIKFLPAYVRFPIIFIAITLFTYLVGFSAPVIRASIMGIIGYFVLSMGRKGDILAIILATAMIMITLSPLSINYDVSLHLSFLAVLGIVYTEKWFEKIFFFVPQVLEIRTALSITFAALVFTLPIMIFNFGQVSILAPIANVAVTWTIPIAMLLGFVSIIIYPVWNILGIIVGFFTWILLRWDIWVVNTFGSSSFSVVKVDFGKYGKYYEIMYFLILIFLILWFKGNKKEED